MNGSPKKKLAVLGGGPSVMSALYWLTSTPELRARYDITVYQMGWRLGGKGASGRAENGRILEHGLHVLFGFYQNFFYTMRAVYGQLNRPPGHPLRTWRQAFHPKDFGVEEEYVYGAWSPWMISFPGNWATPGSHGALLTLPQYLVMAFQILVSVLFGARAGLALTQQLFPRGREWEDGRDPPLGGPEPPGAKLLFGVWYGAMIGATHVVQFICKYMPPLVWIYVALRSTLWLLVKQLAKVSRRAHRLWLDLDAVLAMLTGTLVDGLLLEGGFERVDQEDYREWLLRHGVHKDTLSTTLVRTIYDAAFSYENGDPNKQRVSAGSTVRVLMRWAMTYKGAAYYLMQAGMGDTVFAPLYQVLKDRGVKFEFFHKVESLHLSEDRKHISSIKINHQAELADGVSEYDPLHTIKGLECWPAEPLYKQIKDPDRIRNVDLESYYSGYVGKLIEKRVGVDFDEVLFGIPVGAVRFLCAELVDNPATPQWRDMVDHVKAVQTVASQIWLKETIAECGWTYPGPLLSLFVEPYNTWADMSQVLPRENWPPSEAPKDVSYFCGAQVGPTDPPPLDDRDFEPRMTDDAYNAMLKFMKGDSFNPKSDPGVGGLTTLLPKASEPGHPRIFNWSLLVDTKGGSGEQRLQSQYWRSNCGPSERCTLSLPNTNQYRIKAGETGYDNLFITGDWTDNNLYLAFMEATFQAGILSARAVAGEKFPIIGEWLNHL